MYLIATLVLSLSATTLANPPLANVLNGTYIGLYLPNFDQDLFLGIPYAQSTGGQNRFRVPQTLTETWIGTRNATRYGDACPDRRPEIDGLWGMSEDCLSINVVRPAGTSLSGEGGALPVMVWIHGGSYQVGTSGLPDYNLTYIVEHSVRIGKPIIGVSINYRKGAWGNMYSIEIQGSGNTNLALRDMWKALEWIQENIHAFGGDRDAITIWGESSGSFAVGQLLMAYGGENNGLFHRSIQESGSASTAWYNGSDWYQPIYDDIVSKVDCSDAVFTLDCLRDVPYQDLYPYMATPSRGPGWYPTVDGDIIPQFPTTLLSQGRFAHVPHLYGSNTDEGTDNAPLNLGTDDDIRYWLLHTSGFDFPEFVVDEIMRLYPNDPSQGIPFNTSDITFPEQGLQYKRAAAIAGDVFYHATRLADARVYAQYAPTYVYRFNTRPFDPETLALCANTVDFTEACLVPGYRGVQHYSEVAFVFNNPENVGPWEAYRALSEQMSSQWISFVYDGHPNGVDLPSWPAYNESNAGQNLVLQTESQGGSFVEDDTWRLEGREFLTKWARRRHV